MIHGLFFCGVSQRKSSLIIKLGAGAFQENMMPNQKVLDRSLEFHRFLLGTELFHRVQLVCVTAMRNSWDGFCFKVLTILREAAMKGLEEMYKSSLVFLPKLLAVCCQDSFLSKLVDKQG